ncbi:MAG: hypothetical protein ACLRP3_02085 [Escherichia sp.]
MSSTNIEQVMPVKLAQALANPLFPALDRRHVQAVILASTNWIIMHS